MNEDSRPSSKSRQPHSLKSLADYKCKSEEPIEYESSTSQIENLTEAVESEMKNATVKFVDADSDLTEIFSRIPLAEETQHASIIFAPGYGAGDTSDIIHLQQQLDEEKRLRELSEGNCIVEREKYIALQQEMEQLESDLKDLRFQFREKDDKLKRAEQGRAMLLSKLGSGDSLQSEKASLLTDMDLLRQENDALNEAVASSDKQCTSLQEEIDSLRSASKSFQSELNSKKMDLESKTKELQALKDSMATQRSDMDREMVRVEEDLRKAEDNIRAMQIELMEKTHTESRLKADLANADSRSSQLDADNMTLRRRLLEAKDGRDREVSQLQNRIVSLESELRHVMEDLGRARASPSSAAAAGGVGGGYPGAYAPSTGNGYYPPPPPVSTTGSSCRYPPPTPSSYTSGGGYTEDYRVDSYSDVTPHDSGRNRSHDDLHSSSSRLANHHQKGSRQGNRMGLDSSGTSLRTSGEFGDKRQRYNSGDPAYRNPQPKSLRGALGENADRDSDLRQEEEYHHSGGAKSLAALVGGGGRAPATVASVKSVSSKPASTLSPFATDATSNEINSFDKLEKELTVYMTEKTALEEELSRLLQRGGRTLKDRTRTNQVDARLDDLKKDIARIRRELSVKPS